MGLARVAAVAAVGLLVGACVPQQGGVQAAGEGGATLAVVAAADAAPPAGTGPLRPSSVPGSYLAGLHAERIGEGEAAADFLLFALEQNPDNIDLLGRTFTLMLSEGRVDEAVGLARRLTERVERAPLASLTLVASEAKQGRFEAAEARLRALPDDGLTRLFAPLMLAWALAGEGKPAAAVAALSPLGETSAFAMVRDLHVGLINDLAGNLAVAEESYQSVRAGAQGLSLRLVEALGSVLERSGRADEARSLYDEYMTRNPDSVLLDQAFARLESGKPAEPVIRSATEGMAEALFNLASSLQQQHASRVALTYARLALFLRPDFAVCQALAAEILDDLERGDEAVAMYESIRADSPFHWVARLRVAMNMEARDNVEGALARLWAMSEERPERIDALVTIGDILRERERFTEAVEAYTRADERIDSLSERHWSLLYARGIALERSGQWEMAETDFLRALELRPDQPYVLNYLGYSWVEQGVNLDRARRMLERAVELRPNDGYIVDSMGWVLFRLGLFEEATEKLERAVQLEPQDATINDHLGDAYWRVGRKNEARFQWRRALALKPDPEVMAEIEAKLKRGLEVTRAAESGN